MILHPKFIQDHVDNAKPGFFAQGSRVLLSKDIIKKGLWLINNGNKIFFFLSTGLKNRKNAIHSKLLSIIFSNKTNYLQAVLGLAICHFIDRIAININGFNNEFEGWGREDSEFASSFE